MMMILFWNDFQKGSRKLKQNYCMMLVWFKFSTSNSNRAFELKVEKLNEEKVKLINKLKKTIAEMTVLFMTGLTLILVDLMFCDEQLTPRHGRFLPFLWNMKSFCLKRGRQQTQSSNKLNSSIPETVKNVSDCVANVVNASFSPFKSQ